MKRKPLARLVSDLENANRLLTEARKAGNKLAIELCEHTVAMCLEAIEARKQ